MKTITEWQKVLKAAADRRFPDSGWGEKERIESIERQLDDAKVALACARGERVSDYHGHQDPDHRIAALIADILIFAEERDTDVEDELEKVRAWFEGRDE
ncbi:hypothetical protein COU16_00145 [Candidatus Kaiserbacteria bacterium CG10_big_fil_rev_8_21_14_0_10_47_16]|uniref:NTP pyrophosphohydrolase MazG putative catalytic core domain-containing protein n=1 Tax=Candidatus Kaiserbacteria bacterium CG10_big_fil_rev_8_21_14_0_10_47_16 TaxID=1974608 RepID=A0A2H0UGV8_9BACT|nr:MAG: hypothetical protein COU16_00145 [Candidatus Kaiserbacteria bacterium CG10_big_fil_rev_8_21_14_0_10_47_16]